MHIAHGIHLVICDLLYRKINSDTSATEMTESISEIEDNDHDDHDSDIDDTSETYNSRSKSNLGSTQLNKDLFSHNNVDISATIANVTKIVRMIRKSPLENKSLQNYIKLADEKELAMILNSKTRWP